MSDGAVRSVTNGKQRVNKSKTEPKSERKFNFCAQKTTSNNVVQRNSGISQENNDFDLETDEIISKIDLSMFEETNVLTNMNVNVEVRNNIDECSREVENMDYFDEADDIHLSNIDIDGIVEQHYASISMTSDSNVSYCAEGMQFESDDVVENIDIDAIVKFSNVG